MSTEAVEVRLSTLEKEIAILRTAGQAEAEFRGELRAFIAHFAERDRRDRSIVITVIAHGDRVGA